MFINCFLLPQFVGHMFAYPIVYDLAAKGDEEERQVAQLLDDVVSKSPGPAMLLALS